MDPTDAYLATWSREAVVTLLDGGFSEAEIRAVATYFLFTSALAPRDEHGRRDISGLGAPDFESSSPWTERKIEAYEEALAMIPAPPGYYD